MSSAPRPDDEVDEDGGGDPVDAVDEAAWDEAVQALEAARARLEAGEAHAAADLAEELAARLGDIVGDGHPDTAAAWMVLGDARAALGRLELAMVSYRRALAILDAFEGDDADVVRPHRIDALARVGYRLALDGAYAEAIALLTSSRDEAEREYGADALELAEAWNALGVGLRFAARYDEAAAAYSRAAALRAAHSVPDPAVHHHNLSGLASARGDHAAAEAHARAAVAARREAVAAGEPGERFALGTDLAGLGDALAGLGRLPEAEAAYREALACFADTAPDHAEVAYALHNLADTLADAERWDEAEATYREALARKARALGPTHHELAPSLNNLAHLLAGRGRHAEAAELTRTAVERARVLPPDHPVRRACEALARDLVATRGPA